MKFPPLLLDYSQESTAPLPYMPVEPPARTGLSGRGAARRGRRHWPEGTQYSYGLNGHELTLFLAGVDDQLVDDVKYGEAEFAVIVEHPVLVLAYRFGQSIRWSDVPYTWHLQPARCRVTPPLEASPESRALLWITLVGADDGIIHRSGG